MPTSTSFKATPVRAVGRKVGVVSGRWPGKAEALGGTEPGAPE